PRLEHLLAAESEKLLGQLGRPLRRLPDLLDARVDGIPGIEPLEQEIAPPIDDGEEVVEVVGDAPREAADRFPLLALAKLGFAVAQRLFRAATRDGDPRDVRSPLDDETVGVARTPRLRVVHGERA